MNNKKTSCAPGKLFARSLLLALAVLGQQALAQQARPSGTEDIAKMYGAGAYGAVATSGAERLRSDPGNVELRYMVANSSAWTGRFPEAIEHYKALAGTKYAQNANLGLANVYRWNGLPGAAAPLYQQVLAADPASKDAAEGMAYAMRDLRPQTRLTYQHSRDSLDTRRNAVALSQRWTEPSFRHTFEIEGGALEDERGALSVRQRDLALRYAGVAQPFKPRLEISAQDRPRDTLFGAGEITLPDVPLTAGVGRVNWGKMAFDPRALAAGLTANRVNLRTSMPSGFGNLRGSYHAYRISDDNLIQDANLHFTPAWQPLKMHQIKFFAGFDGRKARFNSPAYWSPRDGSYLAIVGVGGEWIDRAWERTVQLQYGAPLGGEAENSYSASAGLKHWLNESLAVGVSFYAQKSQRTGAYRASTGILSIQGLW